MFVALHRTARLAALALFFITIGLVNLHCGTVEAKLDLPTPTPTETQTPLPAPTETATPTPTATDTATATETLTLTPTDTATSTATPTWTATPTVASTPTLTATPTVTVTLSLTPTVAPVAGNIAARVAHVPILTYHYVRPYPDRTIDPLGYNLSVPPELFEQELNYLQEQGFKTIRLIDLTNYLKNGEPPLPPKPVILTFDDGYADAYVNAFPSLKDHGMVGTFFIVTGFVDRGLAPYVTWDQVKEMHDAGMEIGSHTVNHIDLTLKSQRTAEQELAQSQQALQQHLGDAVQIFCYPYGHANLQVSQLAAKYYSAAVTTWGGTQHTIDTLYTLRRVEISGAYSFPAFVNFFDYWWNRAK